MHLNSEKLILNLKTPVGPGTVIIEWQTHDGALWAITGSNKVVQVFDHFGKQKAFINMPGYCTGIGWDFEGTNLAVINDTNSFLYLWNSNSLKTDKIETGLRDPLSFMAWGKSGAFLAIGTVKGNILLYNQRAGRKVPILGKHTKRIISGAWSTDNLLALGAEDRTLSISTLEGDTVHSATLRSEPSQIQFSDMKQDDRSSSPESTVSAVVGRRTLILININDAENPIELAFQSSYGSITSYRWFGDGYILIGFTGGYCIAISTHMKEIGQELFQIRNHRDKVSCISICQSLNRAACVGDNNVRIHDLMDLKEALATISVEDENRIENCAWSNDGRLLGVTGASGNVYIYLTRLNLLSSVWQPTSFLAVLTSLKEVSLFDSDLKILFTIQCELEPIFLACGPKCVALGLNNHAWIYSAIDGRLKRKFQYAGSVESIMVSESHVAALVDGKVHLQLLEDPSYSDDGGGGLMESGVFPLRETTNAKIISHTLAKENLIYATTTGDLVYFSLVDRKPVSEYRHAVGWKKIYHDTAGTLLIAVDSKNYGYLYSPVKEILLRIPEFPTQTRGVLWESSSRSANVFMAWSTEQMDVYVYHPERLSGSSIVRLCSSPIGTGQTPLLLHGAELVMLTASSKLTTLLVAELDIGSNGKLASMSRDELLNALQISLGVAKYGDAWTIASLLDDNEQWIKAAHAALNDFKLDFASNVYRHLGDISMVWSLEEIMDVEDIQLLSGHLHMILGRVSKAQECYLKSSQPDVAIDMHTDIMEWEKALSLAEKLSPQKIGLIAREYAQQLEQTGDYVHSLLNYERALNRENGASTEHQQICQAGIARSAIGSGDIRKGISLALNSNDPVLLKQCAGLLEDTKYYLEAAEMFEMAGSKDQAALLYARLKNWAQVGKLIQFVTQPKVHIAYAKAKEAQGQYKDALISYESAGDFESAILLCLNHLHNPQEAVRIARRSKSTEGAKLIGKYFMDLGDYTTALEYLIMSKNYDRAFEVAKQNGQIQLYADILGDQAQQEDYAKIASHYEMERNFLLAGKYSALAGQHSKAFKFFIKAAHNGGDEEKAINAAIHIVSTSKDDQLAAQLIGFLNGEQDNIPKDGKFLFRFYLARQQYKEASKTAMIIATEEQNAGNYRDAHSVLYRMYQELASHNINIPMDMERNLQLLHSYIIVRLHIRRGQHLNAARLLIRVAESISKFPSHVVPILTSTVIECDRAGLKNAAFQYAAVLVKPEYRDQLDAKYKKKIEGTVRRPPKGFVDPEDDLSPCPFCDTPIPSTLLLCLHCKQPIPICIVTGMHVVKNDLTRCPSCHFMAIRSEFIKLLENNEPCPMCAFKVSGSGELVPWTELIKTKIL